MKIFILLMILPWSVFAAVSRVTEAYYVGLSSDTKPAQGVREGAVFYETDTMKIYRCAGTSNSNCNDWDEHRLVVEQQYSLCIDDADKVCKATAGFLHSVFPQDANA